MLSAPWIVGPITPCSRKVKVEGLLPRATVHLMVDGVNEVGRGAASRPDELIDLDAGETLKAGMRVTAWQERPGQKESEQSPIPYTVLAHPRSEALGQIFLLAQPVACGTCLGFGGIVPGSTVTVTFPGRPPVAVTADWTEVHVELPFRLPEDEFIVQQMACPSAARVLGPEVKFPAPLKLHQAGHPLPPPIFEPRPHNCQGLLRLSRVQPGATIKLTRTTGAIIVRSGGADGEILLPSAGLKQPEPIEIMQEYASGECHRPGEKNTRTVDPDLPREPWFAALPSLDHPFVSIGGLVPGAIVHIYADDEPEPFILGAATRGVSQINLPSKWAVRRLRVRQSICDGALSDAATADVLAPVGAFTPRLFSPPGGPPVYQGAASVALDVPNTDDWQMGLGPDTLVQIISAMWRGTIGEAIATGDHYTDVSLWLPLVAGDEIQAFATRCAKSQFSGKPVPVTLDSAPIPPPLMPSKLDDCGGSVWVDASAGVMVDLEHVDSEAFATDTAGVLLASVRVNRPHMPVPLPPLPRGAWVRARARRGGERTPPSKPRPLGNYGLTYDANSAFRVCQLTGDTDPVARPHFNMTLDMGLYGTDLGIPVHHRGKLWLFFGDATGFEFLWMSYWGDRDPFAWTTDGPDPDSWEMEFGPTLEFIHGSTDFFMQLLEAEWYALFGGLGGLVLGSLFGTVAEALAAGVTLAALGALIGWFIDIVPDKEFTRLAVEGLPDLENFEVPSGGFSYNDRVYLFIARHKAGEGDSQRMHRSYLATSKSADPADNFENPRGVSSSLPGDKPAPQPAPYCPPPNPAFPAGEWLVHVSPTVVRNDEVPGLPSSSGDGLVMFGTGLYHASNVRVAWAPLTPGQPPPPPGTWRYLVGPPGTPPEWLDPVVMASKCLTPRPLLLDKDDKPIPDGQPHANLGELSVSWSPVLRRWMMTVSHDHVEFRVTREPGEPWTDRVEIFNRGNKEACADNGNPPQPPDPGQPPKWVGLPDEDGSGKPTVTYAPYHIPRWTRFDRSTRKLTIYYVLSTGHPPYHPQLMRARLTCV